MAALLNTGLAMAKYQTSITLSKKYCFPHEEAIACERAAMFLSRSGSSKAEEHLLLQAYECYDIWGAESKKAQLMQRHPSIVGKIKHTLCDTELQIDNDSLGTVSLLSQNTSSTSCSALPKRKRPML